MEVSSACKVSLIFLAAVASAFLLSQLAPWNAMHQGGCGPRALHAVAVRLGNTQTEAQTLALFRGNGDEVMLGELESAAPKLRLAAQARQMTVADLRRERPLGVLHIDDIHFVAVVGYDGDAPLVVDPLYKGENRPVRWFYDDLAMRWDGAILVVTRPPPLTARRQRK